MSGACLPDRGTDWQVVRSVSLPLMALHHSCTVSVSDGASTGALLNSLRRTGQCSTAGFVRASRAASVFCPTWRIAHVVSF